MKNARETLEQIEALPQPRHLFVLPEWADPAALDQLMKEGFLTCDHLQRDDKRAIIVAMGLKLTQKGNRLLHPKIDWSGLALRGSLAGASFAAMSVLILYLG